MQATWQDPPEYGGGSGPMSAMPRATPVVRRLLLANVVVFLATFVWYLAAQDSIPTRWLGLTPSLWKEWAPFFPVWQLFTWAFLHDVQTLFHIVGNMLFLYFLGTMLEGIVGGRRFLAFYFAAILVTGFATLVAGLISGVDRTTIGASGAVLAVVVAMAVLRPMTRIIFILFPITLRTLALMYVGFDVFYWLLEWRGGAVGNVAHGAHLVGAAFGFASVKLGWIWNDPVAGVEAWRASRAAQKDDDVRMQVDRLLERIHKEGISSLSDGERAFLKRASKRR